MRFLLFATAISLLANSVQAQSVEATMPTPILGNGQADAVQNMNGGGGGMMTDGVTPSQKRNSATQAIREALAREELARQAKARDAAEKKAQAVKSTGKAKVVAQPAATVAPAGQGQAEPLAAPVPQQGSAPLRPRNVTPNAEDRILQQMN